MWYTAQSDVYYSDDMQLDRCFSKQASLLKDSWSDVCALIEFTGWYCCTRLTDSKWRQRMRLDASDTAITAGLQLHKQRIIYTPRVYISQVIDVGRNFISLVHRFQHWRRQGGPRGPTGPAHQWPVKNFFVKIEGLLEPVVSNLRFRVRSNAMFTSERRY